MTVNGDFTPLPFPLRGQEDSRHFVAPEGYAGFRPTVCWGGEEARGTSSTFFLRFPMKGGRDTTKECCGGGGGGGAKFVITGVVTVWTPLSIPTLSISSQA